MARGLPGSDACAIAPIAAALLVHFRFRMPLRHSLIHRSARSMNHLRRTHLQRSSGQRDLGSDCMVKQAWRSLNANGNCMAAATSQRRITPGTVKRLPICLTTKRIRTLYFSGTISRFCVSTLTRKFNRAMGIARARFKFRKFFSSNKLYRVGMPTHASLAAGKLRGVGAQRSLVQSHQCQGARWPYGQRAVKQNGLKKRCPGEVGMEQFVSEFQDLA